MREKYRKIYTLILLIISNFIIFTNVVKAETYSGEINLITQEPSQNSYYSVYDYVIDRYDIDIKVNEDNTYDITETLDIYFNIPKHGIYRTLPLTNKVTRLDGTSEKNNAYISNVKVNDLYTTSRENNNYKIKIGSSSTTLTGKKQYIISYKYNIGKDRTKRYDELYFNIIGSEWDTVIGNITFTITMPKDFDESKLSFSSGRRGATDSSRIVYDVNENVITGYCSEILTPGNAITVRAELPDGYFIYAEYKVNVLTYLLFIIPVTCLLITILLWYKFGKDKRIVETVEYYPPNRFNSLEVGYLYKGKATEKDVTSLLIYLANKGYLRITETKDVFDKYSFEITKLKEYDGHNNNEKEFINGLFNETTDDKMQIVTKKQLQSSFYKTMKKILRNMNSKYNKKIIFEETSISKAIFVQIMIIISLLAIIAIPLLEYIGPTESFFLLNMSWCFIPFYAFVLLVSNSNIGKNLGMCSMIIINLIYMLKLLPYYYNAIYVETITIIGILLGIFCIIGMVIFFYLFPKRNKYGNEMLGKIKGFKTFIETAEKEKLEEMVIQEPTYFYDVLSFAYVLNVSDKWIRKFETISMQVPNWYSSISKFEFYKIRRFVGKSMSSFRGIMSSDYSSYSSSGSSSGGNSSGGGSGGGGGGSW